jgi:hypothetical protein
LHPNKEDKKDKEDKDNGDKSPSPQNRVGKRDASIAFLVAQGVDEQHAADWLTARKGKEVTATAWTRLCNQAALAGLTPAQAVEYAAGASWVGFEAEWFAKGQGQAPRLTGRQQVTQGAARAIFDFDEGGQQAPRLTGNDEGVIDV